ncbi:MAG: YtxH domain-containing protein [Bacteroidetes bacterium]|nr:YtxH domain-containing protein [Bacteroidota bacterium]
MSTTKTVITVTLATAGAFFTGLAVGLLISPKSGRENRGWLKKQADEIGDWVEEQSKEAIHETEEKIKHLQQDVRKKIKDSIPDLYEATADIHLSEEELIEREYNRG